MDSTSIYQLFERLRSNTIVSVDIAKDILQFILDRKGQDSESLHLLEDELAQKFIQNLAEELITNLDTIKNISKIIKQINKTDFDRWYA